MSSQLIHEYGLAGCRHLKNILDVEKAEIQAEIKFVIEQIKARQQVIIYKNFVPWLKKTNNQY